MKTTKNYIQTKQGLFSVGTTILEVSSSGTVIRIRHASYRNGTINDNPDLFILYDNSIDLELALEMLVNLSIKGDHEGEITIPEPDMIWTDIKNKPDISNIYHSLKNLVFEIVRLSDEMNIPSSSNDSRIIKMVGNFMRDNYADHTKEIDFIIDSTPNFGYVVEN